MSDDENLVPEDELVGSPTPDAVVILEEKKPDEPAAAKGTVVETKTAPKDAAAESVESLAKSLEDLKKKNAAAESRAVAAESRVAEAETKAATAESKITSQQQQNIDANRTAATNAMEVAKSKRDQAKRDYITLQAEGNFDEAFEKTQEAAEAAQEIKNAEGYLRQLEAAVEKIKNAPKVEAPTKPVSDDQGTVDPVTGTKFTPKTFAYIEAQGDNWKDQDFRIACDAANKAATRKGIKPDTDEWVEFMDAKLVALGFKDEPEANEDEPVPDPEPKPTPKPTPTVKKPSGASVSAAPTRAVAGSSGVAKKGVKLSGAERDVAASIIASLPELFKGENPDVLYAKNKQALIDEHGESYLDTPTR